MATATYNRSPYSADQGFFIKMALGIAGLIVFGFAQWAARGFVVPATVPIWVHFHGLAMLSWLALFVTQNVLVGRGNIARHRKLGWSSVGLVTLVVAMGSFTAIKAIALHRVPPFFTNSYFLSLSLFGLVAFVGTFGAAIALRRQTEWHRRLMLGATIILMEPGLGRLLPMPLLGPVYGPVLQTALQLLVVWIVLAHDRRTFGRAHPATLWIGAIIIGTHATIAALSQSPWVIEIAQGIATS
jgi:hypothetical protein